MDSNLLPQAMAGNADALAQLEEQVEKIVKHKYCKIGQSILHTEAENGNLENVQYIIQNFTKTRFLCMYNLGRNTALHLAAEHGHTQVVEVLIDAARHWPFPTSRSIYISIESFDDFVWHPNHHRNTALHLALKNDHVPIAELLVKASLPQRRHRNYMKNNFRETPIYMAAKLGFYDLLKLMCTTWTDLDLDGPDGFTTAFHAAVIKLPKAEKNDRDAVMELLKAFAKQPRFEALLNKTDQNYDTVLSLAVRGNHMNLVELLINEDPAFQNGRVRKLSYLKTLKSLAAEKGYTYMVELLSQTYDSRYVITHTGQTALHKAISKREKELVNDVVYLRSGRSLLNKCDDEGWKAHHYIGYYGFELLVGEPFFEDLEASEFEVVPSPLNLAAKEGHTSTVIKMMELLPASFYTLVDSSSGQNILHSAVVQNKKEMIRHILTKCPKKYIDKLVNQKDLNGDTPLHLLIRDGCFVRELIKHKLVDRRVKNNHYRTCFDMLYFQDEIIADQAKIKKALDDFQADQCWRRMMFWRVSINKKSKMPQCLVPSSKRITKDNEFMKVIKSLMNEKRKQRKDDLDRYRQRTNIQIIVTALITTVTFTVGFTMPGGYHQDGDLKGMVILSNRKAFTAFMVSDALALLLSTSSLFLYFIASMYENPNNVAKLNDASTFLNIVSIIAMMLTFITGTYVVLSDSQALAITVIVISCFFFLLIIIILLIKLRYDHKQDEIHEDEVGVQA